MCICAYMCVYVCIPSALRHLLLNVCVWFVECLCVVRGMSVCGSWSVCVWFVECLCVVRGMSSAHVCVLRWNAVCVYVQLECSRCHVARLDESRHTYE